VQTAESTQLQFCHAKFGHLDIAVRCCPPVDHLQSPHFLSLRSSMAWKPTPYMTVPLLPLFSKGLLKEEGWSLTPGMCIDQFLSCIVLKKLYEYFFLSVDVLITNHNAESGSWVSVSLSRSNGKTLWCCWWSKFWQRQGVVLLYFQKQWGIKKEWAQRVTCDLRGFASVSNEQIDSKTLEMVSAGLQLSLRMSRQIWPLLFMLQW
jgi:hypothetical protein